MVSAVDQQRVCALLTEAMTVICKNGLTFNNKFCIEGLLGITMDDNKMFLVNIRETVHKARADGGKQHQSDSISKAGMLVGGRPVMQQTQQGLRTGSPMGLGRPGMGVGQGNQMLHQRRRGGAQPQNVIPVKRPMLSTGGNPHPQGAAKPGQGGGSIPQEWAALIQLQQQQRPPGQQLAAFQNRGRGRPPTARRGGVYRGGMQVRGVMPVSGEQPVKSPVRRNSQGGVELESKEEIERKAAEQARSRSERLQRRQAAMQRDPTDKTDTAGSGKDHSDPHDSTGDKTATTDPDKEVTTDSQSTDADDGKPTGQAAEAGPDESAASEDSSKDKELTMESETGEGKDTAPKEEEENENSTEGGKEESKEGDGSWLLSNSNWLLGDLEAPTNDSSVKMDTEEEGKGDKNDAG